MTTATALPPYNFAPATNDDMPFIRDTVARLRLDGEGLEAQQFIVLPRGGRGGHIGFRGVPSPQDEPYITTGLPESFERLGFLRTEILPPELEEKIARVEGAVRSGVVGMVYDRRIEQRPTLADVYRAKHAIEPYLQRTPLVRNPYLSRLMGCEAYLKLENLQPIGGFKGAGGG